MSGLCPLQEQTQSDLIAAAAPLRPGPEVEVSLTAVDRRVDSMLRSDRLERKPGRARIVDVSHCRGTMSTLPLPATTCGRSGSVPLQRRGDRARQRRPCVLKRLFSGNWPEYRPCGAKVMSSAEAETAAEVATDRPCTGSCDRRVVAGIMGQGSPLFTVRQLDRSAVYLFDVHFLGGSQSTTTKTPKQRCERKISLCIYTKLGKPLC